MYLRVLLDVLRGIYPMFRWLSNTCIAEMYSVVFDTYRKRILEYHGIRLNTEAQRGAYSGLSEYVKIRLYCENTSEYVRIFGREYNGIWEEEPGKAYFSRKHQESIKRSSKCVSGCIRRIW